MRTASRIVAEVLEELVAAARSGRDRRLELDRLAEELTLKKGARPAFKGYKPDAVVYRHSLCVSINNEIVHGIPRAGRKLSPAISSGLISAWFIRVSTATRRAPSRLARFRIARARLMEVTREALVRGNRAGALGNRISDIARAVQRTAEGAGFSVVTDFAGHGIGRKLHEDPQVPNYFRRGMPNPRLQEGMVLAIEPMINEGTADLEILDDGWTAVTADGKLSAHFEHSIAITAPGPEILSELGNV